VVPVYETLSDDSAMAALRLRLTEGSLDAITFTASSTVRSFMQMLDAPLPEHVTVACIGPVTAQTARERGLRVDVEAETHSIPGLVAALERHYTHGE
jgi:uroporphyrinogen III methyltransferase/synthase